MALRLSSKLHRGSLRLESHTCHPKQWVSIRRAGSSAPRLLCQDKPGDTRTVAVPWASLRWISAASHPHRQTAPSKTDDPPSSIRNIASSRLAHFVESRHFRAELRRQLRGTAPAEFTGHEWDGLRACLRGQRQLKTYAGRFSGRYGTVLAQSVFKPSSRPMTRRRAVSPSVSTGDQGAWTPELKDIADDRDTIVRPEEDSELEYSTLWRLVQRNSQDSQAVSAVVAHFLRFMKSSTVETSPTPLSEETVESEDSSAEEARVSPSSSDSTPPLATLDTELLSEALDCTIPQDWYPLTRSMHRRVIAHVGPTNSGKTFQALQRMKEAQTGLYCGPLRLLAWEIHERLSEDGVPCDLMTGQESITARADGMAGPHLSCTVEMAQINREVEVAVVDEVQYLAHPERGAAWSRSILGIPARELHVCGEPRVVPLLEQLCRLTGDTLEVHEYKRLSPLSADTPIKQLSKVRRGDCVIAFSRKRIYAIKQAIQKATGLKCCVLYGSLPPATRKLQAKLFNDPNSGYDVLVASDAVGLGVNLSIRRIVFSEIEKFDGETVRPLNSSEIRQIAGRAGRFGSQYPKGLYTTVDADDMKDLQRISKAMPPVLDQAALFPTLQMVQDFASHVPPMPFSLLLSAFAQHADMHDLFFMRSMDDVLRVADAIEPISLDISQRFVFCLSPTDPDKPKQVAAIRRFAAALSNQTEVKVGIKSPELVPQTEIQLQRLEETHAVLDIYLWLSRRFHETGLFVDYEHAAHTQEAVALLLAAGLETLSESGILRLSRSQERRVRRKAGPHASALLSRMRPLSELEFDELFSLEDRPRRSKKREQELESLLKLPAFTRSRGRGKSKGRRRR